MRRALEAVLPDMPVKQRAEDEEPYLFASLASAAPHVTFSWLSMSDDGKERTASPFIEAMGGALERLSYATPGAPRPALEHAIAAGAADHLVVVATRWGEWRGVSWQARARSRSPSFP